MLDVPILTIKAKGHVEGTGRSRKKTWLVNRWYCKQADKDMELTDFEIVLVNNGYDFIVPCVPSCVFELQQQKNFIDEYLKDSLDVLGEMLKMIPKATDKPLRSAFVLVRNHLTAAARLSISSVAGTGYADKSLFKSSQDLPLVSPQHHLATRKRSAPSPPEKSVAEKKKKVGDGTGEVVEGGSAEAEGQADVLCSMFI